LNFDIIDIDVAKYLGIKLPSFRKRLTNTFSKTKQFIENVDYIRVKNNKTNASITYMLNYQCFERLAMNGDSKESETIRLYFVKLREFIVNNQYLIFQAMENKNYLKNYSGFETIYFFAIDERKKNIFKIGKTIDIVKRLRNYNVGRIKEVELKYLAVVKNSLLIENCMKLKLKINQVYPNREIYKVDPQKLKKIIDECYCKNVSKKENMQLYRELSNILGLYSYTKNKVNIKPFIIIDQYK